MKVVRIRKEINENNYITVGFITISSDGGKGWFKTTEGEEVEVPKKLIEDSMSEIDIVFGSFIDKLLPYYKGYENHFFYKTKQEEGDFKVEFLDIEYLTRIYGCHPANITTEQVAKTLEDRFWWGEGEEPIRLEGWKRLIRHYGKYRAGLSILVNSFADYGWKDDPHLGRKMNIQFDGKTSVMRGEFFVSKKGTNCFRVKKDGKHLLIRIEWGGSKKTRGLITAPKDAVYFKRASSNAGRMGYDYVIFPVDYVLHLKEEDVI